MARVRAVTVQGALSAANTGRATDIDPYDSPIETLLRISCKSIGLRLCREDKARMIHTIRLLAMDIYALYSGAGLRNVVLEEQRDNRLGNVLVVKELGCGTARLSIMNGEKGEVIARVECKDSSYECVIECQ
ncbi:hypothetical protein Pyrde_1601 [Pyrodictium delaneyi]|uniref:Uncharacterized protein n=1 Tax=Pyrodictium delaneyi TaxID=1273541 RepID=A0A0P0N5X3_9CREN|nr:hypothetical protein [Pyrodictium delaneyi]ALL01644.1 hypothetical protein Pyrde_1601 [Pyrodictium delaneyi]